MLEILIPMAGEGRRFTEAGYQQPKPYIDVAGKPMIERVVDSLTPNEDHRLTLLTREKVGPTNGAVSTLLAAAEMIDLDQPVLVANCDQYLTCDINHFLSIPPGRDGTVMVFNSTNPHHSYVTIRQGLITGIAEKHVISDNAVVGIYWFSSGQLLMDYAEKVIANNTRHNGEFYVSAILGAMIDDGLQIAAYEVDVHHKHMWGTPEELHIFLDKVADRRVILP